ncbi:retropepsin-like aspartic protease [Paenibacillus sp. GYB004]|uniref:retropepsin-like aspartic protease n=1 Tax=Paenibacillus sp. GYB004 TaxID=2994393 RepID=UPI002F96399A
MLSLEKVLIDTGSASTLLNADIVGKIDMIPEKDDVVDTIRGVGGVEYVYTKSVDAVIIGEAIVKNFQVEIGSMDYGMDIHGIIVGGDIYDAKASFVIFSISIGDREPSLTMSGKICCRK